MRKINTKHAMFINWMPSFVEAIKEIGGSATPKEVRETIANKMGLDDDFLNQRLEKSGQLRFDNQVHWARQYLTWEGLVENSKRGVWTLTDEGWKRNIDYNEAYKIAKKWNELNRAAKKKESVTAAEQVEPTEADVKEDASLLDILKQTTPTGFEQLCGRLLREYDFENIEITKQSRDGGIDGTATLKLNPFLNTSVFFQCKRYESTVPISHIREFVGVLTTEHNGVDKGIFITTGNFTKEAFEIERKNTKLELIDGEKLVEMFEIREIGVKPRTVYDPNMAFFAHYIKKGQEGEDDNR
ncbi:MAG: restriction endonuclease [Defluviitaleaceae bacterium]|nr:restriction endonuclease [Defluviitaleaceae bacterium]